MSTTVSYSFIPQQQVFVITDDYTLSRGTVLRVEASKYVDKSENNVEVKEVLKYIVSMDDGTSTAYLNGEDNIFDDFIDALNYLDTIL